MFFRGAHYVFAFTSKNIVGNTHKLVRKQDFTCIEESSNRKTVSAKNTFVKTRVAQWSYCTKDKTNRAKLCSCVEPTVFACVEHTQDNVQARPHLYPVQTGKWSLQKPHC